MLYNLRRKNLFAFICVFATHSVPYLYTAQHHQPSTLAQKIYTATALVATTLFNKTLQPPKELIEKLDTPDTLTTPEAIRLNDYLQQIHADLDTVKDKTPDKKTQQQVKSSQQDLTQLLRYTIEPAMQGNLSTPDEEDQLQSSAQSLYEDYKHHNSYFDLDEQKTDVYLPQLIGSNSPSATLRHRNQPKHDNELSLIRFIQDQQLWERSTSTPLEIQRDTTQPKDRKTEDQPQLQRTVSTPVTNQRDTMQPKDVSVQDEQIEQGGISPPVARLTHTTQQKNSTFACFSALFCCRAKPSTKKYENKDTLNDALLANAQGIDPASNKSAVVTRLADQNNDLMPHYLRMIELYSQHAQEIQKHVKTYGDSESKNLIRRHIQWHKNHQYIIESWLVESQNFDVATCYLEAFESLLESVKHLINRYPKAMDNSFLAEMCHYNINILYHYFDHEENPTKIKQTDKKNWLKQIKEIKNRLEGMSYAPTNTLAYEMDMVKVGINMFPTDGQEARHIVFKGIAGGIKFTYNGDPRILLGSLQEAASYLLKKGIQKTKAPIFRMAYTIDAFKKRIIAHKMLLNECLMQQSLHEKIDSTAPNANPTVLINQIEDELIYFEQNILKNTTHWQIAYQWVATLGELLTENTICLHEQRFTHIKEKAGIKSPLTLSDLEKKDWVNQLPNGLFVLNPVLSGTLHQITYQDNKALKGELLGLQSILHSSDRLERFIYFGDEQFNGLKNYMNFGAFQEKSWIGMMQGFGNSALTGLDADESLEKSLFDNLDPLKKINKHIEIALDQIIHQIQEETLKKYQETQKTLETSCLHKLSKELEHTIAQHKKRITEIKQGFIKGYIEKNTIVKDLQNEVASFIDQIHQERKKIISSCEKSLALKNALYSAYDKQEHYIGIILNLLKEVVGLDIEKDELCQNVQKELHHIYKTLKDFQENLGNIKSNIDSKIAQIKEEDKKNVLKHMEKLAKDLKDFSKQLTPAYLEVYGDVNQKALKVSSIDEKSLENMQHSLIALVDSLVGMINVLSDTESSVLHEVQTLNELYALPDTKNSLSALSTKVEKALQDNHNDLIQAIQALKTTLVDNTSPAVKEVYDSTKKNLQGLEPFAVQAIKKADNIANSLLPIPKNSPFNLLGKIEKYLNKDTWRVRQRVMMSMYMTQAYPVASEEVKKDIRASLLYAKCRETHEGIRIWLDHPDYAQDMTSILQDNWESEKDNIQEQVHRSIEAVDKLREKINEEEDEEIKKLLVIKCREEHARLSQTLKNLTGIEQQMGIVIHFLDSMKKQLSRMEEKLDALAKDIQEIKEDIRYLRGKTVRELFEMRKRHVDITKKTLALRSLYVELDGQEKESLQDEQWREKTKLLTHHHSNTIDSNNQQLAKKNNKHNEEDSQDSGEERKEEKYETTSQNPQVNQALGTINAFLWQEEKDALLIHGQAGSGKSTLARKIEEHLWDVYTDNIGSEQWLWSKKQKKEKDRIAFAKTPVVPIMISLPLLKHPKDFAVEETLKSDAYRFDDRQINDVKEHVQDGRLRIVFIMDSYDELQRQYITLNLYETNKLAKWGLEGNNEKLYPKVITTTRNEIFTPEYPGWFIAKHRDKASGAYAKEVQLVTFNKEKRSEYLTKYTELSIKTNVLESYLLLTDLSTQEALDPFSTMWHQIIQALPDLYQREKKTNEPLLNAKEIENILHTINGNKEVKKIFSKEQQRTLAIQLEELWHAQQYAKNITDMGLVEIVQTPFMMEIVVQVLPQMIQAAEDRIRLKANFMQRYPALLLEAWERKERIQFFQSQKGYPINRKNQLAQPARKEKQEDIAVSTETMDNNHSPDDSEVQPKSSKPSLVAIEAEKPRQESAFVKKAEDIWNQLTSKEEFTKTFTLGSDTEAWQEKIQAWLPISQEEAQDIVSVLRHHDLTRYDFYVHFIDDYYKRQINKWKDRGEQGIDYDTIKSDLILFAKRLAFAMTAQEQTQINYEVSGKFYQKETAWDEYFKDDDTPRGKLRKLLRSGIPLKQKTHSYAFVHKSIQEFLVAQTIYQDMAQYARSLNQDLLQHIVAYVQAHREAFADQAKTWQIDDKVDMLFKQVIKKEEDKRLKNNIWDKIWAHEKEIIEDFAKKELYKDKKRKLRWEAKDVGALVKAAQKVKAHPLNQAMLISDFNKGMIQFLTERISSDQAFEKVLWAIIHLTKLDKQVATAASNAISLLNIGGSNLKKKDLQGIHLKQAYLRHANLYGTDLSKAYLEGINLAQANLNRVNFSEATLRAIQFGEYAFLRGHTDSVDSACYSPDGDQLASGSKDKTVRIWSTTGRLLHTLQGHTAYVNSVCYSPDGGHLASASSDNTVRIWSAATGKLLRTLQGHTKDVNSVCYSPDGGHLASASSDNTVRIWSAIAYKLVTTLQHTSIVNSVNYAPDGEQLASALADNTVRIWSATTGELVKTLQEHTADVYSVCYSPDGRHLASASRDHTVCIWSNTGTLLQTLREHTADIYSVCYSPDGQHLASASRDHTVRIWSNTTGKLLHTLEGHIRTVAGVCYAPDGGHLASVSYDRTVRIWPNTGKRLHTLEGHTSAVMSVIYAPNGKQLASASKDNTVRIWSTMTGRLLHTLEGHISFVNSVSYAPNGGQLASGSRDNTVRIWSTTTGRLLHTLEGHTDWVNSVCYDPDGKHIASASQDKSIRIWSTIGNLIHILHHTYYINSVCYSPDGKQLASTSPDNKVQIWSKNGVILQTLEGHTDSVQSVCYAPDGRSLASTSLDNTVRIWSTTGRLVHTLQGHTDEVNSASYAPSSKQLVSASSDYTMRIWSTTGKLLQTVEEHISFVNSVCYSPDGRHLVSGSDDNTLRIWEDGVCVWISGTHDLKLTQADLTNAQGLNEGQIALIQQKGGIPPKKGS